MTALTEVLNPFLLNELKEGQKVNDEYVVFPVMSIYSATDAMDQAVGGVVLSNVLRSEVYSQVIDRQWDINIYASQVTIASDLINPGRNITIYCDRLTILGEPGGKPILLDVSSSIDTTTYRAPLVPQDGYYPTPGGAISGQAILNDYLANPPKALPGGAFEGAPPGNQWGAKGPAGGKINIVCNVLTVLAAGLTLKANGGPGYPGCNGQNRNFVAPASVGGDAGAGGAGGDGGSATLSAFRIVDGKGSPLSPDVVTASANGGVQGQDGFPGHAQDSNGLKWYGSAASPVTPSAAGSATNSAGLGTFQDSYLDPVTGDRVSLDIPDLSEIARNAPLTFWGTLYHRVKLSYIENQATGYTSDSYPPGWQSMKPLIFGANCLTYAYTALTLTPTTPITDDPDLAEKQSIAKVMSVMMQWYRAGNTMWGNNVTYVDSMPWACKMDLLDSGYQVQQDVRNLYIAVRKDFNRAVADQNSVNAAIEAAKQASDLHSSQYDNIMTQLVGGSDEKTQTGSLQSKLLTAQEACDVAEAQLVADMADFTKAGKKFFNFDPAQILSGLSQMAFVGESPGGMGVMAAVTAYQTLSTAFGTLPTNNGANVSKDVLKQVVQMSTDLGSVASAAVGIGSQGDKVKSTLILGELSSIDKFVEQFTTALGTVAQTTLDAVKAYRDLINAKNDAQVEYSNLAALAVQEYQDYQISLAKYNQLKEDAGTGGLSQNALQTVSNYAQMYLNQLEVVADAVAWLRRKWSYLTFGAALADNYVGKATAFWSADAATYDGSLNNDDALQTSYTTVQGYKTQFAAYESNQVAILETSGDAGHRSLFYIDLDGAIPVDAALLKQLFSSVEIRLTPNLPASDSPALAKQFENKYSLENGGNAFNIRVTNVVPSD